MRKGVKMDFTKILEYQDKDGELYKIERELNKVKVKEFIKK
jgi:hypothetical protein